MVCYGPLTAYRSKDVGASGKRGITFQRNASHSAVAIKLPCGQCTGCRLERSRQWAMRCMHEKQLHEESCFITLTYDDDALPKGGTLVKRDLQLFMKRLRKLWSAYDGRTVRFYACGEYGERFGRPHYHAILFGCDFPDRKFFKRNARGEALYTSETLGKLWPCGHNSLGAVTFDSAAYVARYVMKKVTGDVAEDYYTSIDADGVVYNRVPEFTNMSRRPGIGSEWFARFGKKAYEFDSVVMNGKEVRPPRYYDGLYEVVDARRLEVLKRKRRRKALSHKEDQTSRRLRVREIVTESKLKLSKREIEP